MTNKSKPQRVVLSIGLIEQLAPVIREHAPLLQDYAAVRRLLEIADSNASQPRRKRRDASKEEEVIADAVVRAWADGKAVAAIVRESSVPWIKTESLMQIIRNTLFELVNKRPDLFLEGEFSEQNYDGRTWNSLDKHVSAYRSHLRKAFDSGWKRDSYFPHGFDCPSRKPTVSAAPPA